MKTLDDYLKLQQELFDYFRCVENCKAIPIDDARAYYWYLIGDGPGTVHFADSEEELDTGEGNSYSDEIYTRRLLPKGVYRGADFTMICCNPQTDGKLFLRIFDNAKRRQYKKAHDE